MFIYVYRISTAKSHYHNVQHTSQRPATRGQLSPMICVCDEDYYNVLKVRHDKLIKNNTTLREPIFLHVGYPVAV